MNPDVALLNNAVWLASWEKVSREDIRRLLRNHTPDEAVDLLKREIRGGMPDAEEIERKTESVSSHRMGVVIYGSEDYPDILINIPDPPVVLFYRGDLERFLGMPAIAVIGSRRCTAYGRKVARKLARDFVRSGVAVVSGLARGIDGEAHRGAIEAGGVTMAVLGNGLDLCYPPEHDRLSEMILGNGVILSEYPPGTEPARYRFPERNRLISGFSRGVVVVEAGKRSGTMITVNTALDQGKDVFAVPGEVTRAFSMGTNMLLRDGAGVVITAADVLEPLGLARDPGKSGETFEPESDAASAILEHLSIETLHFNQLLRLAGVGTAVLQSELLSLEMAGVVMQHPGKFYSLK
ncbi:MAG: DNA-protecting protein DprA [Candidatus Aegiribacteria sp.]|nr:DNA-protecting protein DprA [Candidatus Aegiribacteria sp.]